MAAPKGAAKTHVSIDFQVSTLTEPRRVGCDVHFVFVTL
jgi:hypothetical protein